MKWFPCILLLLVAGLLAVPGLPADAVEDAARANVEKANARLEKLRQAHAVGAVSRRELEEAEEEVKTAERRLQDATNAGDELTVEGAKRRVENAREDFQKAEAKARRLEELFAAGAVARNEVEAARTAASQTEVFLKLNEELARRVEIMASMPRRPAVPSGEGGFSVAAFFLLQDAYYREFRSALPVSAFGPTETHERLGFDHEGRVDIALHPDSNEGRWLIAQLNLRKIPFIAFRNAVNGKATGPHIHMGFPSPVIGRTAAALQQ